MSIQAYAAYARGEDLKPFEYQERPLRPEDVHIDILYSGICHSDVHQVRNDWGGSKYPMVPGHEILGRVRAIGSGVRKYKVGDTVAVGCMVDSCLKCSSCKSGEEQLCLEGATFTYNSVGRDGQLTYGGYASGVIVREEFVLRIPEGLDPKRAAPILCAGITTYSPLKKYNVKPGTRVGVVGLGGLGHMAIKLATAMGANVTLITTSPSKADDGRRLGAQQVLLSKDPTAMKSAASSLDLIIDTVPNPHDLAPYLNLLGIDGTLVIVGVIDMLPTFHSSLLLFGRRKVTGSPIGGIAETQEVLDFCAKHNILPDCEMIGIQDVNKAYTRMDKADVKYRFVIDMETLPKK